MYCTVHLVTQIFKVAASKICKYHIFFSLLSIVKHITNYLYIYCTVVNEGHIYFCVHKTFKMLKFLCKSTSACE